jgi:large subunit ribosomal protein L22
MIMNIQAVAKNVRVSPRKVRLVADAIRNMKVDDALNLLYATPKAGSSPVAKALHSAVANAVNNAKLTRSNLIVSTVMVNEGQAYKRFRPSTRGRIHPYKKRGSNLTIVVTEKVVSAPVAVKVAKEETKKVVKKDASTGSAQREGKK